MGMGTHTPSSCIVLTIWHEICNCSIFISNAFASYILQSLPARYTQGKSEIKISALQVRGGRYMHVQDIRGDLQ